MGGGYEFNQSENLTIASVAKFARMWGIISLISGVLVVGMGAVVALLAGAVAAASATSRSSTGLGPAAMAALGIALIPSGVVSIIGGIFYTKSGSALRAVVDTQGDDIRLMTEAMRSLSTAFKIEAIAMAVGFVIGLVIGFANQAGGHR